MFIMRVNAEEFVFLLEKTILIWTEAWWSQKKKKNGSICFKIVSGKIDGIVS